MKSFVKTMLVIVALGSLLLLPPMYDVIINSLSGVYRQANQGHFMLHPATIAMAVCLLGLPIILVFAICRSRFATLAAVVITLCIPLYLAYGLYGVSHGLDIPCGLPTLVFWLVIMSVVTSVNLLLYFNIRTLIRGATPYGKNKEQSSKNGTE